MEIIISLIAGFILGWFGKSLRSKPAQPRKTTSGGSTSDASNSNPQVN